MKGACSAAERKKKHLWMAVSLVLALVFSLTGGATSAIGASQNLIVNGDFETGDLENWEFSPTTEGSAVDVPNSTCFRSIIIGPGYGKGWQGVELFQTFTAPAGTWVGSPELRDLLQDLAAKGQIDEALAALLIDYVDDAQAALDEGETETTKEILEDLICEVKALDDNETTEAILKKAQAVQGTFD